MKNITAFDKKTFIEAVILANKELYTYINTNLSSKDYEYTNTIGFGGDNSLKMDLLAENIFIKYLRELGNIYSEECGLLDFKKEYTFIIDPLDGSNNFYSNLPYYGTSVAIQKDGFTVAGFVTNLVSAVLSYRAFDDEVKQISLIDLKELDLKEIKKAKISIFERAYNYPDICEKLNKNSIKFRCLGAVALSLSDAKNYNFVLYAGEIRIFDIEAALYICNDLFIHKTDKFLLISKNKEKFELIKEFIKEK
ncbi:inositol monophosphatase family protein [Arcobacter sp. s6]|uniref:inositol monophosphatase family protein n=1 Tax=Arcobacter sp. s6 TaxID=3230363 RepID=UPI0034A00B2E